MRLLIQRVKSTVVRSDSGGELLKIGPGFLCYIGISGSDTAKDAEWVCGKILNTRLWNNGEKTWQNSVTKQEFEVLLIPQPSLTGGMDSNNEPIVEEPMDQSDHDLLFDKVVGLCEQKYSKVRVKSNRTTAVRVHLINDGPVTLEMDSPANSSTKQRRVGAIKKSATLPSKEQKTPAKKPKQPKESKATPQTTASPRTGPQPCFPMSFYSACLDNFEYSNVLAAEGAGTALPAIGATDNGGGAAAAVDHRGPDEMENALSMFAYSQMASQF
jgi:D-tyrosyl-tRNA(Tyr) deacylase